MEKSSTLNDVQFKNAPEGLKRVYSNTCGTQHTPTDIRITFGEVTEVSQHLITVENRVVVTVPWSHAAELIRLLQAHVAAHEEANGPIGQPKCGILAPPVPKQLDAEQLN
jgi:hypothetical protein